MSEETTPKLVVSVKCSTCGMHNPQTTEGCEKPGCTWRAEAIGQRMKEGGTIHVAGAEASDGYLRINFQIWPKVRGDC